MSEPFLAQINLWANAFTVERWATCAGQLIAIGQNPAVFSLVGTLYGGDGRVSMGLPNLQHRAAMGSGTGPGLSPRNEGWFGGLEAVTLSTAMMPAHNHGKPIGAATELAETNTPGPTVTMGLRKNSTSLAQNYKSAGTVDPSKLEYMSDHVISMAGGNIPHDNMQPYLGLTFQMALDGIYPPRS